MAASPGEAFVGWTETHAVREIRALLDEGLDPGAPIRGRTPIEWMIEMYTRSPRFSECVRALIDAGAEVGDAALEAVLLDDAEAVSAAIAADPEALDRRITLRTTYVLLADATLLHVAADFGNLEAARALLEAAASTEATAAVDSDGLGGQTPLFHCVNSNHNHCAPVMHLLLHAGACVDVRLGGLRWGVGFPWETTLFDVTPISFAQCGLLPQFHRDPEHIHDNVEALLAAAGRPVPQRRNVPNAYLEGRVT